jgi:hypothetical protein
MMSFQPLASAVNQLIFLRQECHWLSKCLNLNGYFCLINAVSANAMGNLITSTSAEPVKYNKQIAEVIAL